MPRDFINILCPFSFNHSKKNSSNNNNDDDDDDDDDNNNTWRRYRLDQFTHDLI